MDRDDANKSRARVLGERIRARREAAHLNQSQLAVYANVSPGYVSRLEKGVYQEPSYAKLEAIARVLHCTADELLGVAPAPSTTDEAVLAWREMEADFDEFVNRWRARLHKLRPIQPKNGDQPNTPAREAQ